jgi:hypothetical protein
MKIWIKLNDSWGFVGISKNNVDNHMTLDEISSTFGENALKKITELNNTNHLTDELIEFMLSIGWVQDNDSFKSNGDVHAFAFEKNEKNK